MCVCVGGRKFVRKGVTWLETHRRKKSRDSRNFCFFFWLLILSPVFLGLFLFDYVITEMWVTRHSCLLVIYPPPFFGLVVLLQRCVESAGTTPSSQLGQQLRERR